MKNTLIVLPGPTGVGKTAFATGLAERLGCEIISCDSRQFYREMKIGTAAPGKEELARVRHHFVGFLSVTDYYSISLFERDVLASFAASRSRVRISMRSSRWVAWFASASRATINSSAWVLKIMPKRRHK